MTAPVTVPSALPDLASEDCVFCGIVTGRLPAARVLEDDRTLAFLDTAPATRGHVLVVPRQHVRDLLAVGADDLGGCSQTAQRVAGLLVTRLGATGVNVLNACGRSAWQTVAHLHLHVVPRYDNDALRLPWVPRPAAPQDLEQTAALLR